MLPAPPQRFANAPSRDLYLRENDRMFDERHRRSYPNNNRGYRQQISRAESMETSRRCTLNHPPGQGLTNSTQSQAPNFARQNQRHNRRQNLAQHGYDDDYSHPFRVAAEAQHSLFQENDKQYGDNINAEVAIYVHKGSAYTCGI